MHIAGAFAIMYSLKGRQGAEPVESKKMKNLIKKAQQFAHDVNANGWDYYPDEMVGFPENFGVYNYEDGIWLVDTKDEASMQKAEKWSCLSNTNNS